MLKSRATKSVFSVLAIILMSQVISPLSATHAMDRTEANYQWGCQEAGQWVQVLKNSGNKSYCEQAQQIARTITGEAEQDGMNCSSIDADAKDVVSLLSQLFTLQSALYQLSEERLEKSSVQTQQSYSLLLHRIHVNILHLENARLCLIN